MILAPDSSYLLFLCVFMCVFVFVCQLKNSLKNDLCLDQGPDNDNVPILYLCHGMTPQVRALHLSAPLFHTGCSTKPDLIYHLYILFPSWVFLTQ